MLPLPSRTRLPPLRQLLMPAADAISRRQMIEDIGAKEFYGYVPRRLLPRAALIRGASVYCRLMLRRTPFMLTEERERLVVTLLTRFAMLPRLRQLMMADADAVIYLRLICCHITMLLTTHVDATPRA